jgi:hypothetical protein
MGLYFRLIGMKMMKANKLRHESRIVVVVIKHCGCCWIESCLKKTDCCWPAQAPHG